MGSRPDHADLTSHFEFARRLAAQLVGDTDRDDVAQEAMAAALSKPPRDPGAGRAFVASIVRRVAGRTRRRRSRRQRRERAVARPESVSAADELAAAMELHRMVVDEVMQLPAPQREVVLLRFVEDLSAREVAARLGLPLETVRTRLKRALALLRGRLDGRIRDWRAILAGLLTVPRERSPRGVPVWLPIAGVAVAAIALLGLWLVAPTDPGAGAGPAAPAEPAGFRLYVNVGRDQIELLEQVTVRVRDGDGLVAEHRIVGRGPYWIEVPGPGAYSVQLAEVSGYALPQPVAVVVRPAGLSHTAVDLRKT